MLLQTMIVVGFMLVFDDNVGDDDGGFSIDTEDTCFIPDNCALVPSAYPTGMTGMSSSLLMV